MNRKVLQWGLLLSLSLGLVVMLPACDKDSDDDGKETPAVQQENQEPSDDNTTTGNGNEGEDTEGNGTESGNGNEEGGTESPAEDQPPQTLEALNIKWVKVTGTDEFLMGNPESSAPVDEKPQHKVKLASFWMSATEITNAQYNQFRAAMKAEGGAKWEDVKESGAFAIGLHEKFEGADQPVVMVSYKNAMAFCEWVGQGVTLPTEAQWEYACRANTQTVFNVGDILSPDQANIKNSTWQEKGVDVSERTRAVGQYPANAFGLFDMHGNAWEWCADWYGVDYYQTCKGTDDATVENPVGPDNGVKRVRRGGSWSDMDASATIANRNGATPTAQTNNTGFRIVAPVKP